MNLLIKSATIIDPGGKHHGKKADVLVKNGKIEKIAARIADKDGHREVRLDNLHLSPGWFDSGVSFGEPGYEERETIENGLLTATHSGFSAVALNPNAFPVPDTKADIKFALTKAHGHAVNLYPVGALTQNSEGKEMAELHDMHSAGAVAFYDYQKSIANPEVLSIALRYCLGFGGLVSAFPMDGQVAAKGVVNEGKTSTALGLKGIPSLAEELQVARDLSILEYTGGKLHIPTISTAKSVALIRNAKKKGLDVSCSAAAHHLILTDDELAGYDTNLKVLPPLRTKADIRALIKGLKNGVIDGVTSDHNPIDIEHKKTEFDRALFGSIGLESCFGSLNTIFSTEETVTFLTRLKKRFGLSENHIEEGKPANLTLFDPDVEWTFSEPDILSTSRNAAMSGRKLRGRAYGVFSNNKLEI